MLGTNSSVPAPASASAKEDARTLLVAILDTLRDLANSKLAKWANLATIGGLFVAVLALLQGIKPMQLPVPSSPIAHPLQITQPVDGATAGPSIDVRGTAPLDGKKCHYYLIVTPPQGSAQIQADPMDRSPDGELHGHAVLGNGSVGIAQTFTIQILASTSAPKSLLQAPSDSERSKAISVTRQY